MKQTLLKKIPLCAILLSVLAVGEVFAQEPTPSPKKINFSQTKNPTSKSTRVQTSQKTVTQTPDLNEAKIVKVKSEDAPNQSPVDQPEANEEKITAPKKEEEKSRLTASVKTLEIAKRAAAVEVSPTEIYKVGIGDVLFISLQNAPAKETTYFTVLNNGNIDYPLAGGMIQVLGYSIEQIEDLLKEKIKLYENPQVSIKIREHNSHIFTVLGLVDEPGEKTMEREAVPLYLVQTKIIVNSRANELTIKRGTLEKQIIDLKDSKSGDTLVYPGDILEFRANNETANLSSASQFYFITGEINSVGRKPFIKGITLTQAIIESGDLRKKSVRKVIIRRKNDSGLLVPNEFDLKSIKYGKAIDPVLEAGDTIEIGN